MNIYNKRKRPTASKVFDTYWKFAYERQNIFFNRIHKITPLTNDAILLQYKFTNAYRASDRVSQYLINEVIYKENNFSEKDLLLRILLFKIFNKIETWEIIQSNLNKIDLSSFSFKNISHILEVLMSLKKSIYSAAYIMASGKNYYGFDRKHDNHLKLLEKELVAGSLFEKIKDSKTIEEVYLNLKKLPTFGEFLAFQLTIDINYSNIINFSEMDFIVAGPGAKDGIHKCFSDFGDFNYSDIIKYVTEIQESEFERLELDFKTLGGRKLQLIDCQNLFCETDKYSRVKHPEFIGKSKRVRIKQTYKPKGVEINYSYPPSWEITI
ncbi:hypothetical protein J8J42_12850 [Chryseobacterium sp. cx-311]|uniref:nucleotide kinase domain-containing protein n=1 Tax=Marnyiella aurantia TaxID=2758037 RepID=UPI001AE12D9D|nr:nucleotide kinase domain-containing protein [Marnyiella aurantia]MBP0613927.1 hypothetical protein [Marnyiella aurantia]